MRIVIAAQAVFHTPCRLSASGRLSHLVPAIEHCWSAAADSCCCVSLDPCIQISSRSFAVYVSTVKLDLSILGSDHRLEDFLKELPAVIRRAEPCLTEFFDIAVPMERRLKLRELQTSFVYTTVLAKKSKVGSKLTNTLADCCTHVDIF